MNRYQNIPKTKIEGNLVYQTSRYPEVPLSSNDIYVYTTIGDRFDTLSQQYYGNSSLWWVISIANTDKVNQSTLIIPEGLQIRIPANYSIIVQDFNIINA
jgi:phage tail protein X